jgi:hypothetical protein
MKVRNFPRKLDRKMKVRNVPIFFGGCKKWIRFCCSFLSALSISKLLSIMLSYVNKNMLFWGGNLSKI